MVAAATRGEVAPAFCRVLSTPWGVRMRLPRHALSLRQARSAPTPQVSSSMKSTSSRGGHQLMSGGAACGSSGQLSASSDRRATDVAKRTKPAPMRVSHAWWVTWARTSTPRACNFGASSRQLASTSGHTTTMREAPASPRRRRCWQAASPAASGPAGSRSATLPDGSMRASSLGLYSEPTSSASSGQRGIFSPPAPSTTTSTPARDEAAASFSANPMASSEAGPPSERTKTRRSQTAASATANSRSARPMSAKPTITQVGSEEPWAAMSEGSRACASHGSTMPFSAMRPW